MNTNPTGNFAGDRLATGHREHSFHGRGIGWMVGGEPATDGTSSQRSGGRRQRVGVGGVEFGRQPIEQIVVVGEEIGLARQHLDQVSARRFDQTGQEIESDAIA